MNMSGKTAPWRQIRLSGLTPEGIDSSFARPLEDMSRCPICPRNAHRYKKIGRAGFSVESFAEAEVLSSRIVIDLEALKFLCSAGMSAITNSSQLTQRSAAVPSKKTSDSIGGFFGLLFGIRTTELARLNGIRYRLINFGRNSRFASARWKYCILKHFHRTRIVTSL